MISDLSVVGPNVAMKRYLVAGGTKVRAGEPVINLGTITAGANSVNTFVLAAADFPTINTTTRFGGIAVENAELVTAGTVIEQFLTCACPTPSVGRIRGKAETVANVDTLTELALLIGDVVLIDYAATGASDGGPLYTIKDLAGANTSGLELVGGNTALSTLDVTVCAQAYRSVVS
jgi:hypothetical protein